MQSVWRFMKAAVAGTPVIVRDLAGLAGAGLIAYGAYEIYRPAGFIAGGILLLTASFLAARVG